MQEILPRAPTGPPEFTSPAALGELSRRLPSDCEVQNFLPSRNGLVGSSRMWLLPTAGSAEFLSPAALTGLRKTSTTAPFFVTTTIALRSLVEFQMFPSRSSAMPSVPSRYGCAANTASRQSVFRVNVLSHPMRVLMLPS